MPPPPHTHKDEFLKKGPDWIAFWRIVQNSIWITMLTLTSTKNPMPFNARRLIIYLYNRQVQEYGGTSHSLNNDWEIINPIFFNNAWTKGYLSHWNSERSRRSGKIYKGLKVELETPFSDLNTRSCRTGNSIINTSTRRVCKVNDSRGNIWYKSICYGQISPEIYSYRVYLF
jgi:hypothetical protein